MANSYPSFKSQGRSGSSRESSLNTPSPPRQTRVLCSQLSSARCGGWYTAREEWRSRETNHSGPVSLQPGPLPSSPGAFGAVRAFPAKTSVYNWGVRMVSPLHHGPLSPLCPLSTGGSGLQSPARAPRVPQAGSPLHSPDAQQPLPFSPFSGG